MFAKDRAAAWNDSHRTRDTVWNVRLQQLHSKILNSVKGVPGSGHLRDSSCCCLDGMDSWTKGGCHNYTFKKKGQAICSVPCSRTATLVPHNPRSSAQVAGT